MDDADRAAERRRLVEHLRRRTDASERTLSAIAAVPRHEFVPEGNRAHAYDDRPLPIGHGQTISAPHMVAVMVDLIEVSSGNRVFEVGTGCGYHAAVVAEVVGPGNVYSVEYVPKLADAARDRLDRLGYDVTVRSGDGRTAFAEREPFDAAYLTCAAPGGVPEEIVDRTRPGGHVVAPVESGGDTGGLLGSIGGRSGASQRLVRLTVRDGGGVDREDHGAVRFVPMK
ncbi:protein-L-isoaspartate(D-aspartate) O-methyltransferase [Halorubrum aquaticum]|uniref:Protein-L-isoaspartate O-methyltransferase n=1 Tax=Halorubrum aquaticum TaxID=387340 RepID=A0A1I3CE07_9EURY|nr:protein-L-isoaspartate O-methyltransferase [Halorubrum aquaticum]SFH72459.1 protein-L-isoaspartate(D-aspartate) O-methyltransferase [Halorubrum aquaticum]